MVRNINLSPFFPICALLCIVFSPPALAQDSQAIQTANKAIAGILKAATNTSATKICEAVLPVVFCDIVVGPVVSAIYEDYPLLAPNREDSLSESQRKAAHTIELLQNNEKYQALITKSLDKIGRDQGRILREIRSLGKTQAEIQTSIQSILLYQAETRKGVEELIQRQEVEEAARRTQAKSTLYSLHYRAKDLVDERKHTLHLLKALGEDYPEEFSALEVDYDTMEKFKTGIELPENTLDKLESLHILLNKFIVVYERRNQMLKEVLDKAKGR